MSVQSIERAFSLLRALTLEPLGVTELAERVGLPKSTVARLLAALETEGAVEQLEAGGEYRLGSGLVDIAGATLPGRNLVALARAHLLDLSDTIGEIAGISVLAGREVHYIDHTESRDDIQVRDWTGEYAPLHAVPSGLVILAHLPEAETSAYLAGPIEPSTTWTVTDPTEIRSRLENIRSIGYAWVYEEFAEGINSVAAPVFEPDGTVRTALHVHGPAYRFPDPDRTHDTGLLVVEAAKRLADQLAD